MLDLLYHKGNPLITAVVDDSIFKKILKTILERKMLEDNNLSCFSFCIYKLRTTIYMKPNVLNRYFRLLLF